MSDLPRDWKMSGPMTFEGRPARSAYLPGRVRGDPPRLAVVGQGATDAEALAAAQARAWRKVGVRPS